MPDASTDRPRSTPLLLAAAFALANGGWSAFLWQQLLVARSGGEPYCALGGGCATLWDGRFASQVHATTGLPVAAWGLVWSVAALALTLRVWWSVRNERAAPRSEGGLAWLGLGGALVVSALIGVSVRAGDFCGSCAVTYALVALFGGCVAIALPDLRAAVWTRGIGAAALATCAGFLLLLYPGLQTPQAGSSLGAAVLPDAPDPIEADGAPPIQDPLAALQQLIETLPPAERQALANARARYLEATPLKSRRPRALIGARMAPVRIATWTDSGCSHCASFHDGMSQMLRLVPGSSIAIDQRVFPLDRSCNPRVLGAGNEAVCLAAKVRICLEESDQALALSGWLHEDASPLDTESIYRVATRLAPRKRLEACVRSNATKEKLLEDIQFATEVGLKGTPFILVNGRPSEPYVPFLYALAITQGNAEHPIYDSLPAPKLGTGHEGHAHD